MHKHEKLRATVGTRLHLSVQTVCRSAHKQYYIILPCMYCLCFVFQVLFLICDSRGLVARRFLRHWGVLLLLHLSCRTQWCSCLHPVVRAQWRLLSIHASAQWHLCLHPVVRTQWCRVLLTAVGLAPSGARRLLSLVNRYLPEVEAMVPMCCYLA